MDLDLHDRTALVTGGSRGIGRAIARQLGREGVRVAIVARSAEALRATALELSASTGSTVMGFTADMGVADDVARMTAEVADALGPVDILVNNAATAAGRVAPPPWLAVTGEDLGHEIDVKVLGYLRAAQAVAPAMIDRGWGRIINIGGQAAYRTGYAVGTIRNVAVAALTKNLADELGRHGITVTCVHPGLIRTVHSVTAPTPEEAEAARRIEEAIPKSNAIRRILDVEHIADIVTFLASPRSIALNGEVLAAGGGMPGTIRY